MRFKLYFLTIILAVLIAVNAVFIVKFPKQRNSFANAEILHSSQAYVLPISEPSYLPILVSGVDRPLLDAKSAGSYDTRSGRFLFAKSAKTSLPVASLTKIMTSLVVLEHLNVDDVVKVPAEAVRVDKEKQTLYLNEELSVLSLMKLMLIGSSNDAAYALARHFKENTGMDLVEKMNEKAQLMQMTESHFLDPAGLDDKAYSTVEDMTKLVRNALKQDLIWDITMEKSTMVRSFDGKIEHKIESTNQLFGVIPDVVGGKTGYTDIALGCMVLIVDIPGKNDKIISIILGSKDRFGDTQKLLSWVKTAYSWE